MTTTELKQLPKEMQQMVANVLAGEIAEIQDAGPPLVRLVPVASERQRPLFGSAKGWFELSDDFNEPLDDFEEYQLS